MSVNGESLIETMTIAMTPLFLRESLKDVYTRTMNKKSRPAWIMKCPSCKAMGITWDNKEWLKMSKVMVGMDCPKCGHSAVWNDFYQSYSVRGYKDVIRVPDGTLLIYNEQQL